MDYTLWPLSHSIKPDDRKALSQQASIRTAPLPSHLYIALQQHQGPASIPIVTPGQKVLKGQVIAEPDGATGVYQHASTSGVIEAIAPYPSMTEVNHIVLRSDGEDRYGELTPHMDYATLSPAQIQTLIWQAGIVGLGGAGFPTHLKQDPQFHVNHLILNGCECEPYITCDDRLMCERASDIVHGALIMAQLHDVKKISLAIEDNKPAAIAAMTAAAAGTGVKIVTVPTLYPSGAERSLITILTGEEIPSAVWPVQHGIVMQNVATAYAISRAVRLGEPLISRITTMTGMALNQPGNFEVYLGTPLQALLEAAGVRQDELARVIVGGALMGSPVTDTRLVHTKLTNCIIAATAQEFPEPPEAAPCIRCGHCEQVCPANLAPQLLYEFAKRQQWDKTKAFDVMDCIECGACAYVCPSDIPLVPYYQQAKHALHEQAIQQDKATRAEQRFAARQTRLQEKVLEAPPQASIKPKSEDIQQTLAKLKAQRPNTDIKNLK